LAGPFADRFAHRPLFMIACLLAALGLLGCDVSRGYTGTVLLLLLSGLGCGCYSTIINTAVVERYAERSTASLALVHSAATAGAGVGPLLIRWSLAHGPWTQAFHALGFVHLGLFAVAALGGGFPRAAARSDAAPPRHRAAGAPLLAFGAVAFAYVGVENGLTLFAVPWAASRAEPESIGQWAISSFWIGLLIGRLGIALRPPRRGLQLLAAGGLFGALIVSTSSALGLGPLVLVTGLAGVALGPIYPLMLSLVAQRYPAQRGTTLGLVAGIGAAGGFSIPWLIGAAGDALGIDAALSLLGAETLLISIAALTLLKLPDAAARQPLQARTGP
jgi:fucose permease